MPCSFILNELISTWPQGRLPVSLPPFATAGYVQKDLAYRYSSATWQPPGQLLQVSRAGSKENKQLHLLKPDV